MAETQKPSNVTLTIGSFGILIAGVLASLVQVLGNLNKLPSEWNAVTQTMSAYPSASGASNAFVLVIGVVGLVKARARRSWLRQPDQFNLDPANPRHLKGREQNVADLLDACVNAPLVKLTGESGSGKTAVVRSGLLPALERDRRLYPLYLDAWGRDWESGPWNGLAAVLQRTLGDDEHKALGLDRPVTKEDVFPLLASFREKVGRAPLVIFDQFDDYQAAHRGRFRTNRGFWLKPATVANRNAFWREVRDVVGPDRLHVLFVTRADAAAGLDAVTFCDSESLPLDRLDVQYLSPLLDEIAPAAGSPPVVDDPETGWAQLKKRLVRDLQREGLALPVQVLAAVRGLACLPGQVLTIRNYERVGGAAGLEAAYVEQSIHKCVQAVRGGGLKVGPEEVRRLLLAMVDEKESDKTILRPGADLVRASGVADEDGAVRVLTDLERRGLVRRRAVLSDSGNGVSGAAGWSLYHDYLSRGVTAAERRANRWANHLKEGHETFRQAVGTLRGRWRALLSPIHQIQLAWHRLRGRFHYGHHAGYARWCTLRFVPWLLGFAALACATALAEYEREGWVHKQQLDDAARKKEQQRLEAENTASNLLREVAYINTDALHEVNTLWNLAESSALTREYFWMDALADEQLAGPLNEDEKFDQAFHAMVGLDPDDEKKRDLADQVVATAIDHCSAGPASTDFHRLGLLVRLDAATGFTRDNLTGPLFDRFLEALTRAQNAELARALAAVTGKLNPAQARQAFDHLLTALTNAKHEFDRPDLAAALAAVAGKLDSAQGRQAFDHLLTALANTEDINVKAPLARVLAVVAGKLDPPQAREAFDPLLTAVTSAADACVKAELVRALAAMRGKLDPAQVRQAFDHLLTALVGTSAEDDLHRPLAQALAAVAGKLDPAQALQAFDGLLTAIAKANGAYDKAKLVRTLAAVPGKLDPAQARQVFDVLLTSLANEKNDYGKAELAATLAVVPGKLDPAQARRAQDVLLTGLADAQGPDTAGLAKALAAMPGKLDPAQACRLFNGLLTALANANGAYHKTDLAEALAAVAGKLDPAQARQASDILLTALANAQNPCYKADLATALGFMPGELDPAQTRQVFDVLLTALADAGDSYDKATLAKALCFGPGKLDPAQACQAFEGLVTGLTDDQDCPCKAELAELLAAVAGKLDPTQVRQTFDGMLTALVKTKVPAARAGLAQTLAALPGEFDADQLQTLFDILKQPTYDERTRAVLLKRLEKESGQDFQGNLSAAARWGREKGLDVTSPPRHELK